MSGQNSSGSSLGDGKVPDPLPEQGMRGERIADPGIEHPEYRHAAGSSTVVIEEESGTAFSEAIGAADGRSAPDESTPAAEQEAADQRAGEDGGGAPTP